MFLNANDVDTYIASLQRSQPKSYGLMIRTGCLCIALPQIRQGGVGLLMSKHIYKCLQSVTPVTKRIISTTFHGNPQLTVTSVYAPTECPLPDDKDDFYNDLNNHLEQMKPHNIHLVVGDFNARVGLDSHSIHPEVIGRHCFYGTTNNNGERLVDLCEEFQLRPAQMRFPHPRHRLWTWMHPSGSTHQLDHILINNKWKNSLRNCRAYKLMKWQGSTNKWKSSN